MKIVSYLTLLLFAICGCGTDIEEPEPEPVNLVSVQPTSGNLLKSYDTITLIFDGIPTGVTTSLGTFTTNRRNVVIKGFFVSEYGWLTLDVSWDDGSTTLMYMTVVPDLILGD